MKINKLLGFIILLTVLAACKTNGINPVTNDLDIYVSGSITIGNKSVPCYWKNGSLIKLTDTNSYGTAYKIAVNGSDVYVAGNYNQKWVYWKNGVIDSSKTVLSLVIAGSDVYLCGSSLNSTSNDVATYWKNGVPVVLSSGNPYNSYLISIKVLGNDVYAVGSEIYVGGVYKTVYWKNGVRNELPNCDLALQNALNVSGSDVYVGGRINNGTVSSPVYQGAYWKNGTLNKLSSDLPNTNAIGLTNNGNDVYLAGQSIENNLYKAVYWKNGNIVTLSDNGQCEDISIVKNDVYVAGFSENQAVLWKNGVAQHLGKDAGATSIAIVQR